MKCHVKRKDDCSVGYHEFMISRWIVKDGSQISNGYICKHCLIAVDGKFDIDKLRESIHADELEKDDSKSSGTAGAVPENKGSCRKK